MLYFKFADADKTILEKIVEDTNNEDFHREVVEGERDFITNRNDIQSFEEAVKLAKQACALEMVEGKYIATDDGSHTWPRYDVIEPPKVDALVSYTFNGDYYPAGKITKISASFKRIVATDDNGKERVFYRRRESGAWIYDGTWSMVPGHIHKLSPEF